MFGDNFNSTSVSAIHWDDVPPWQWQWATLNPPVAAWGFATAIQSFADNVSPPCQTVMVFANIVNGDLATDRGCGDTFFTGGSTWSDEGMPPQLSPATGAVTRPTAVSYLDYDDQTRIDAFVVDTRYQHLFRRKWIGSTIDWADHGLPPGHSMVWAPSAVTYIDATGRRRVYVFALSDNYHLVVNYCVDTCDDTSTWHWADQGTM